jgi:hypothetical protein
LFKPDAKLDPHPNRGLSSGAVKRFAPEPVPLTQLTNPEAAASKLFLAPAREFARYCAEVLARPEAARLRAAAAKTRDRDPKEVYPILKFESVLRQSLSALVRRLPETGTRAAVDAALFSAQAPQWALEASAAAFSDSAGIRAREKSQTRSANSGRELPHAFVVQVRALAVRVSELFEAVWDIAARNHGMRDPADRAPRPTVLAAVGEATVKLRDAIYSRQSDLLVFREPLANHALAF